MFPGLACDLKGRFIVTDEQTNLVSVFSDTGKFLKHLTYPNDDDEDDDQDDDVGGDDLDDEEDENANEKDKGNNSASCVDDSVKGGNNNSQNCTGCGKKDDTNSSASPSSSPQQTCRGRCGSVDEEKDFDVRSETHGHYTHTHTHHHAVRSKAVVRRSLSDSDAAEFVGDSPCSGRKTSLDNSSSSSRNSSSSSRNSSNSSSRERRKSGGKPFAFNQPRYVWVTKTGKIVVSDSGSHSIKVFNEDGDFLRSIGSHGTGDGHLKVMNE
jgi:hypothetical protein